MLEKGEKGEKGWRKKIHAGSRPKTPLQPKQVLPAPEEPNERRARHPPEKPDKPEKLSWRKTIQGTRHESATKLVPGPAPVIEDAEDTRSEHGSQTSNSTPHRQSAPRPAFSRYLSNYLSLTSTPRELPTFSEPWSDDFPAPWIPIIDHMAVLQSIHSHLCSHFSKPIPPEFHGGLLVVFEDYKKSKRKQESLEVLLKDILDGYHSTEESWTAAESSYEAEIRRLELLIARGATGMVGLMAARQGSVVKLSRPQRKTLSTDRLKAAYEYLSPGELDEQIKMRSQKVLLHRPCSPSGKMAAMSRHFSSTGSLEGVPIGTPPRLGGKGYGTLLRKAKSDLDLYNLGNSSTLGSMSQSMYSDFAESGDPLPDEIEATKAIVLDAGVECEAFVALRDLGTLVARRRGIKVDNFITKFMLLLSEDADEEENVDKIDSHPFSGEEDMISFALASPHGDMSGLPPKRQLRHFRSQPQLSSDQNRRRRHFSFEPGDDQIEALERDINSYQSSKNSQVTPSPEFHGPMFDLKSEVSLNRSRTLTAELQKPSKIPSPVHGPALGRVRRESSVSSVQSVSVRPHLDDRRDSRSSIVTAFRESSGSVRLQSTSRSSSISNLRQAESHTSKEQSGSPGLRNSVMALAAARAADNASHSKAGSLNFKTRAARACAQITSENDGPAKRS